MNLLCLTRECQILLHLLKLQLHFKKRVPHYLIVSLNMSVEAGDFFWGGGWEGGGRGGCLSPISSIFPISTSPHYLASYGTLKFKNFHLKFTLC